MKKYILILIAIIILLLIFRAIKKVDDVTAEFDFTENKFDKDDSNIIKKNMLEKFKVINVAKSKLRNTFKHYEYDNKYDFYLTKIDIKEDVEMDKLVLFNEEITSISSFVTYINIHSIKLFEVSFRAGKVDTASKIIFSMAGDGKKLKRIAYSRDFISYSLPLYTFSLQYESKNNPIDVHVGVQSSRIHSKKGVPFIVSFYKKEKSIYLILMTPINEETKMNESVLGEFINYDNFR